MLYRLYRSLRRDAMAVAAATYCQPRIANTIPPPGETDKKSVTTINIVAVPRGMMVNREGNIEMPLPRLTDADVERAAVEVKVEPPADALD